MNGVFVFIERQINVYLGRQAIDNNDLDHYSFSQALEIAQQKNQPILANFSALWCGACRTLEKTLLSKNTVQHRLRNDVVYVRLEQTNRQHQALFAKYGISSYPTLLLLDTQGKLIDSIGYGLDEQQLLDRIPQH